MTYPRDVLLSDFGSAAFERAASLDLPRSIDTPDSHEEASPLASVLKWRVTRAPLIRGARAAPRWRQNCPATQAPGRRPRATSSSWPMTSRKTPLRSRTSTNLLGTEWVSQPTSWPGAWSDPTLTGIGQPLTTRPTIKDFEDSLY